MDVLIVDDDPEVRDFFKRVLERAGFMVRTADNGLAAFAELQRQAYGAIICDIAMPFLEGRRFYDELKDAHPDQAARVIFVTGQVNDPDVQAFLEDSGQPFLGKPVSVATLVAAVRGVANIVAAAAGKTILVADDEPEVRDLVTRYLTGAGYRVHEASDGKEVFAALAGGRIDLVIADLYMPGVDGIELITRLSQDSAAPPVIAMSGGGAVNRQTLLEMASRMGAARMLAKPFTRVQLLALVEAELGPTTVSLAPVTT
jgi:CheY-like chemotaxis protein